MLSFAIVIPNYNQSQFLYTALESLRDQKVTLQTAIMDGGSKDQFDNVINKYANLITYVRSHPDEGQSAAINEGTEKIHGDIISWLNADDYLFPNALTHVQKFFEENPDVDVVYGDAIHVTPDGQFLSYFPAVQPHDVEALVKNNYICQPACFYRREAFMDVSGVDPTLFYTMDWDLWCNLAANGKSFRYLPKVLAAVRYYPGTKTLSGSRQRFSEIYDIEKRYGTRLLRIAWISAYYHGLTFNKNKSFVEMASFLILNLFKKIKITVMSHRVTNIRNSFLYGFSRSEATIGGECIIHFPWYNKPWEILELTISPKSIIEYIEIRIKNRNSKIIRKSNGKIIVRLQHPASNHSIINISHRNNKRWKIIGFRVK